MPQAAVTLKGELRQDEPLARYTSWRVGGNARQFYRPADLDDLQAFLQTLPEDETIVWLGLGSNLLIRDGGINGTVIATQGRLNGLTQEDKLTIRAEAGVTCAKAAKFCTKLGLGDSAFFAGIPGTVGGALAMNAGAFGGVTWEHVVKVETIDYKGEIRIRAPEDFKVRYRHVERPKGEWFVAGYFSFPEGESAQCKQAITELLRQRAEAQPIGVFSCGSVFRNPDGDYAARLIDISGLKGLSEGDASVSDKHANFIINKGKATATDIEKLIERVVDTVEKKQGIRLIPEVHMIGEESPW